MRLKIERRPKYGFDRPDLIVLGSFGTVLWITLGLVLQSLPILPPPIRNIALVVGVLAGALNLYIASAFVASSRIMKFRQRDKLLDSISWQGVSNVLDVGCGPGLLLIGATKRALEAKAVGIDLWERHAESGNSPERTQENAKLEGVNTRVEVRTGDVRNLPFPDASFDLVLSRAVLHNLKGKKDRQKAIEEIVRVLRPDGQIGLLLVDSWHLGEYLDLLRAGNVSIGEISKPRPYLPPGLPFLTIVLGRKSK